MAEFKKVKKGTNKDYQEEKAWAYARSDMQLDLAQFESAEEVQEAITDWFDGQSESGEDGKGGFGSFGTDGRQAVIDLALNEWAEFAPPEFEPPAVEPSAPGLEEVTPRPPRAPPRRRVTAERAPRIEPVAPAEPMVKAPPGVRMPTVEAPEVEEEEIVETPSQRVVRTIRSIDARTVAASSAKRVRDTVSNVVNRIRKILSDTE